MDNNKAKFIIYLQEAFGNKSFIKLTLGKYRGPDKDLVKIQARRIKTVNGEKISFVYKYKTKDITKNYTLKECLKEIDTLMGNEFLSATLFTLTQDLQLEYSKKKISQLISKKPTLIVEQSLEHNKQKVRYIDQDARFLFGLGITNSDGTIKPKMYDKFQQINKFIETFESLYSKLISDDSIKVVDFGSGKGYLTFALYSYLTEILKKNVEFNGIDIREDLILHSNNIANSCNFNNLKFVKEEIKDFYSDNIDIVVALHACDTATDDSISKGIKSNAKIIILAPCCHKYLKPKINTSNIISESFKFGILNQRLSEILTDTLRALTLEYYGYKTNVFEFISSEHTGRNIMITAIKESNNVDLEKLEAINKYKLEFGLNDYYLDKILELK